MNTDTQNMSVKLISPAVHSLFDYVLVISLLLAPSFLSGLTGWFAAAVYILALVHLAITVMTRFAGGLFSVIPLRIHGLIELLVSIALIISPWILNFADNLLARNFFVMLGLVIFIIWILTDYGFSFTRINNNGDDEMVKEEPQDVASDQVVSKENTHD